jgi:hypothetical protein
MAKLAQVVSRVNDNTPEIAAFLTQSGELDCSNVRVAAQRGMAERWLMADG